MELPVLQIPNTVVFPGMTVNCQLVEPPHRQLMRRVLTQQHNGFVASLPADQLDRDNLAPATPFGTRMLILSAEQSTDGGYLVTAQGQGRQHLRGIHPVQTGSPGNRLLLVPDEPAPLLRSDPNDELLEAWDTASLFMQYADRFFSEELRREAARTLPGEPFYLASFVCANCLLEPGRQQQLLAAPSLVARLRQVRDCMTAQLTDSDPPDTSVTARA